MIDRRRNRERRTNIAVATKVEIAEVRQCVIRGLAAAGAAWQDSR